MWDFFATRSRLFKIFLYLVYFSLLSVVGLDMNFFIKFIFSSNGFKNTCGYPWFTYGFTIRNIC